MTNMSNGLLLHKLLREHKELRIAGLNFNDVEECISYNEEFSAAFCLSPAVRFEASSTADESTISSSIAKFIVELWIYVSNDSLAFQYYPVINTRLFRQTELMFEFF
ncbi:hypothetical protein NPIL_25901 [Nephila pilipes]|uniref:Uncharacterized protein n=1 Tax=Nephila pilipes TaxID=299642 RepID=A0A8X6NP87_NEPPI|nr:hypothetical protein NPIL_25901 [Nephila pilipes]